jgi:hypothetical protein
MLDKLTLDNFESLIGQTFMLSAPDGPTLALELVDVEELPTGRRRRRQPEVPKRAPFSLYFNASALLPQGMYPMQHELFGPDPLNIFIVPVGQVDGGYEYEAVFT